MHPDVSVVIVSYNVRDLLRNCIQSVLDQKAAAEIIVVDNASSDGTQDMIRSEFPQVIVLGNEHNAGFSAANNQGMKVAKGRYIFLLNPDTVVQKGALEILLQSAENGKEERLLAPQLLNADLSIQISCWKRPTPWAMIAESLFLHRVLSVSEYPSRAFENEFEPGMMSGAAMFFPSTWFTELGGLDPELFWMEDADFCVRAAEQGKKLRYVPSAKVVHLSGQSSARNLSRVISNQLLSKLKYYRKHQGLLVMWLSAPFCFLHIVSRSLIFGVLSLFSQSHADKAAAYRHSFGRFFAYLFGGDKRVI